MEEIFCTDIYMSSTYQDTKEKTFGPDENMSSTNLYSIMSHPKVMILCTVHSLSESLCVISFNSM